MCRFPETSVSNFGAPKAKAGMDRGCLIERVCNFGVESIVVKIADEGIVSVGISRRGTTILAVLVGYGFGSL